MKTINEFGVHLQQILRQMCYVIGVDPETIDFGQHDWYMQHTWTQEQEQEFKIWLTDYIYNNNEARKEILEFPRKDKKHCEKAASEFLFNYGWKYEIT